MMTVKIKNAVPVKASRKVNDTGSVIVMTRLRSRYRLLSHSRPCHAPRKFRYFHYNFISIVKIDVAGTFFQKKL
jgi:hypothetical protein